MHLGLCRPANRHMVEAVATTQKQITRYYVRETIPANPWPWAILPAAGLGLTSLFATTVFARSWIQASVERASNDTLVGNGLSWATARADGQQVLVRGTAPDKSSAERALAIVRAAECPGWAGPLDCTQVVVGAFTFPSADVADPAWPEFQLTLRDSQLTVEGMIGDEAMRQALMTSARGIVGEPSKAIDQLTLSTAPTKNAREAWERGAAALAQCKQGVASFKEGRLHVKCEIAAANQASLDALLASPLALGSTPSKEWIIAEQADECDARLRDLLVKSNIEFATASARLTQRGQAILAQVATVASTCPGALQVEGHTDDRGASDKNEALSLARAESVRAQLVELGLAAERIVAKGFGPKQPIEDNATAAGRARNRRIEMRVVR